MARGLAKRYGLGVGLGAWGLTLGWLVKPQGQATSWLGKCAGEVGEAGWFLAQPFHEPIYMELEAGARSLKGWLF